MNDVAFNEIWENLVRRSSGDISLPLTRDERIFYSVNLLRGAVPRSGLLGYFENCTQRDIKDALEGLTELHLDQVASIVRMALTTVHIDEPLSDDLSSLQILSPSLTEDEYIQECDQIAVQLQPLETQLFELDSTIWQALCQFASQRNIAPGDYQSL